MSKTEEIVVGKVDDLPPGSVTIVARGRFGIGVYNVGGNYYALPNQCPHRGAPLCLGSLTGTVVAGEERYERKLIREGEFLSCPWHGWKWDIAAGRSDAFPNRRIRTYPVRVEGGNVILEGT